jgi:hypothetical protein
VIAGCGIGAYFIGPQPCFPPNPSRHGLPCEIPLPKDAKFEEGRSGRYLGSEGTGSEEGWTFTVAGTTLTQVAAFYTQHLSDAGWRCVGADDNSGVIGGSKDNRRVVVHISPPDTLAFPDSAHDAVVLTIQFVTYGSGEAQADC